MLGAIIGDYVGSPYEFDPNNIKTEEFPLFSSECTITDDSIMTLAVADALMNAAENGTDVGSECVRSMVKYGRRYPDAGYGIRFNQWLESPDPQPYDSWGNGSAMRVSAVGWLYSSLEDVERVAEATAAVSHNHPEGIKGAQAVAVSIWLARQGASKATIRETVEERYGYDLSRTLAEIRPTYHHVESCQQTVPQAITAFLESRGFEDALRKAVSIGGDSDTVACITGSIAEAYYGIPQELKSEVLAQLPRDLSAIIIKWHYSLKELQEMVAPRTEVPAPRA